MQEQLAFVILAFVLIATGMFVLIGYEMRLTAKTSRRTAGEVDAKNASNSHDASNPLIGGMSRTLMTFGIILILAFSIAFLLYTISSSMQPIPLTDISQLLTNGTNQVNATQLIKLVENHNNAANEINKSMVEMAKNVLTILGGAISAIVGFYFATRAAESSFDKAKEVAKSPLQSPPRGGPKIEIDPDNGPSGQKQKVKIRGTGFAADSIISIKFGTLPKATPAEFAENVPIRSSKDGSFETTHEVDLSGEKPGDYALTAIDQSGGKAFAKFTVNPPRNAA